MRAATMGAGGGISNYKDDAVVFPPGGDMVKGKQAIQSFWTEAAKGIQIDNFKVTDVRSLGPDTAREQGYMLAKRPFRN